MTNYDYERGYQRKKCFSIFLPQQLYWKFILVCLIINVLHHLDEPAIEIIQALLHVNEYRYNDINDDDSWGRGYALSYDICLCVSCVSCVRCSQLY